MTSKIINMAEHIKDEQDRLLESMFASEPIADDGFSARIVHRVRRRMWLRRVNLPVATVIGLLVSFKPLTTLVTTQAGLIQLLPYDALGATSEQLLSQAPLIVLGGMLLAACMIGMRMLEDEDQKPVTLSLSCLGRSVHLRP